MTGRIIAVIALLGLAIPGRATAQTVLLYSNDFETPVLESRDPRGTVRARDAGDRRGRSLALTFDTRGRGFMNLGLRLSSDDVRGCGGPFGTDVPIMKVSLHDLPNGFAFATPGPLLDETTLTGTAAPDGFTFAWRFSTAARSA